MVEGGTFIMEGYITASPTPWVCWAPDVVHLESKMGDLGGGCGGGRTRWE